MKQKIMQKKVKKVLMRNKIKKVKKILMKK